MKVKTVDVADAAWLAKREEQWHALEKGHYFFERPSKAERMATRGVFFGEIASCTDPRLEGIPEEYGRGLSWY